MRHLGALLAGAAVAVLSLAVHRVLPVGPVLALALSLTVVWVLLRSVPGRLAATYAVGWLVVFGVAVAGRPEGDQAVLLDLPGVSLTLAAFVLVVLGVVALGGGGSRPAR